MEPRTRTAVIGSDKKRRLPALVTAYTLEKHAKDKPRIVHTYDKTFTEPVRPAARSRTGFSFVRFAVPELSGYEGLALYLECDQLVLGDVGDLFDLPLGNAVILRPLDKTNVLVIDCDRAKWRLTDVLAGLDKGVYTYEDLVDRLALAARADIKISIPPEWNSLERYEPGRTKLLRLSNAETRAWEKWGHPLGHLWFQELSEAVERGAIPWEVVEEETSRGHVAPELLDILSGSRRNAATSLVPSPDNGRKTEQLRATWSSENRDGVEFVTSMSLPYCRKYGVVMARGFVKFVHPHVRLRVYHEASDERRGPEAYGLPADRRISLFDLHEETAFSEFLKRALPKVSAKIGFEPSTDPDERLDRRGWNYVWDAVTFGRKAFAFIHAARHSSARFLFWMDADTAFLRELPLSFLLSLFPRGARLCYFARVKPHSETGFYGLDLSSAEVTEFVEDYARYYENLDVFSLPDGWTDSHVFDAALSGALRRGLKASILSATQEGPVIAASALGRYIDHMKGSRKRGGFHDYAKKEGL